MVKLLVGRKGNGKTKNMIHLANKRVDVANGNVIFINMNHRLMYDLKYKIRVVCMEDYEHITNLDEYIGFLYGITSSDHDIEVIFIDSILKHKDIQVSDIPKFLKRIKGLSDKYDIEFIVSLSVDVENLGELPEDCEILN